MLPLRNPKEGKIGCNPAASSKEGYNTKRFALPVMMMMMMMMMHMKRWRKKQIIERKKEHLS
jgi:hypothetical protein